ncbi:hypothetical protein HCN44_011409 [Aphidius gifuensis]|uniref:Uncharacterized protein n=1 Tax=Aphidius gifuensis TaxID=684658 RepID=A0A834XVD6_APHGI|nr:hypothetical protein HCN44_011409 [Aphidius gifuensis]
MWRLVEEGRIDKMKNICKNTRNVFLLASPGLQPWTLSLGFTLLLLATLPLESNCGAHERQLLNDLLAKYNTLERPVANESEPLEVKFGITLQQIIDVDEKNQILTTNAWLKLEWTDYNLQWNESDYGGVKGLRITPNKLWKPDVLMYNSAEEGFDGTYQTNVVVTHNGNCLYVPPGIFRSSCKMDIGMPGRKNTITYQCCPEPYVDVTFTIHIRRRTLYYFFNLIVPCVLISSMALLGFTLPPDSGEKLTLGVTILLSLTVFLNLVAESMPTTSDAVPLIGVTILLSLTVFLNLVAETLPQVSDAIPLLGTYFNCIMFMVASSVVLTVLVLNYHHRTADNHEMTQWIKTVLLQWLPWVLRMNRPGKKITRKGIKLSNKMREMERQNKSSKSLIANVVDMNDDYRFLNPITSIGSAHTRSVCDTPGRPATVEETTASLPLSGTQRELQTILKELQFITKRMKRADVEAEVISDWKFAAMVVDRLCLILFTMFTVIATITVLLSAPHIIVQ